MKMTCIASDAVCMFKQNDTVDRAQLRWRLEEVRVIRYGNVQRLVEALASDTGDLDSSYVNAFLETYRTFAMASDVMNLLLNWFVTCVSYSFIILSVNCLP